MSVTNVTTASDSAILQSYIAQQKAATSSSSSTTSSSTATSITSVTGDFNTFLKILTTQLQNQDPLNATDTNQFTQELVQFSGVEQQINTNSKLDELISLSKSNGITPLLGYVGKTVEVPADGQIVLQSGTAALSYTLPSTAKSVTLTVTDSTGTTVATMNGPTASGVNRVAWDGVKGDGSQAEDGVYKLTVSATDSNDKSLLVSNIDMIGRVTGIQTDSDGSTTLSIGTVSVKASDITAVYSGVTSTASGSSSTTSS